MSQKTRRRLNAGLKAKVALEALRKEATWPSWRLNISFTRTRFTPERSSSRWCEGGFSGGVGKDVGRAAELAERYAKIGQFTVERDFLLRRSGR